MTAPLIHKLEEYLSRVRESLRPVVHNVEQLRAQQLRSRQPLPPDVTYSVVCHPNTWQEFPLTQDDVDLLLGLDDFKISGTSYRSTEIIRLIRAFFLTTDVWGNPVPMRSFTVHLSELEK